MSHLNDAGEVCLANLKVYGEPFEEDVVAEADCLHAVMGRVSTDKGEHRTHGGGMASQAFDAVRKIALPHGHSRERRPALVRDFYS